MWPTFHQEWRRDWPCDATATGSAKAERPGANSRFEEFSNKDGESVDLVTLATLGGDEPKLYVRLDLWINVRSFRIFVVGSVADTTPRRLFTSANSILVRSRRPMTTTRSAKLSPAQRSFHAHVRCGVTVNSSLLKMNRRWDSRRDSPR